MENENKEMLISSNNEELKSEEVISEKTENSDDANTEKSEEVKTESIISDEIKSADVKLEKSEEVKTESIISDEIKSADANTEKSEEVKTESIISDEIKNADVNIEKPEEIKNDTEKSSKKGKKNILKSVIAAVVCLAVVSAAVFIKIKTDIPGDYNFTLYSNEDGQPVILYDKTLYTYENECIYYEYAKDGDTLAFIDEDNVLWYVNNKQSILVDNDVEDFIISDNGKLAYICNVSYNKKMRIELGELKFFDGEKRSIDKDVIADASLMSISANGKYISYLKDFDSKESTFNSYVYSVKDNTSNTYSKNSVIKAISNNGKYFYWVNGENDEDYYYGNLYQDEKFKISNCIFSEFNNDATEMLAVSESDDSYKLYIVKNGGEKKFLAKVSDFNIISNKLSHNTFDNCLIRGYDTDKYEYVYYYIIKQGDEWTTEKLGNKYNYKYVTNNNKYAFGVKDSSSSILSRINLKSTDDIIDIASEVYDFVVSEDGKNIYYINNDSELFYSDGKESHKLKDDVYAVYEFKGNCYFLCDKSKGVGSLYVSRKGDKPEKVQNGDDVYTVYVNNDYVSFRQLYDVDEYVGCIYKINNAVKSQSMIEDIER